MSEEKQVLNELLKDKNQFDKEQFTTIGIDKETGEVYDIMKHDFPVLQSRVFTVIRATSEDLLNYKIVRLYRFRTIYFDMEVIEWRQEAETINFGPGDTVRTVRENVSYKQRIITLSEVNAILSRYSNSTDSEFNLMIKNMFAALSTTIKPDMYKNFGDQLSLKYD